MLDGFCVIVTVDASISTGPGWLLSSLAGVTCPLSLHMTWRWWFDGCTVGAFDGAVADCAKAGGCVMTALA